MTSKEKNCAQNVLGAFGKEFGLSEDITDRMAAPFGGGRYSGETCGCVSAATMVLGLKYGDDETYLSEKSLPSTKPLKKNIAPHNAERF